MALENAKTFIQKVNESEELSSRLAGLNPEETLRAAKELGLEFTEEELKEALSVSELSIDDMEQASGGAHGLRANINRHKNDRSDCPDSPDGSHQWAATGHIEEPHSFLFWDFTKGYDIFRCIHCGMEKRIRT